MPTKPTNPHPETTGGGDSRLALSIEEACQASGLSRSFLYQHIKAGALPIVKLGKRTLIRRAALDDFLRRAERAA